MEIRLYLSRRARHLGLRWFGWHLTLCWPLFWSSPWSPRWWWYRDERVLLMRVLGLQLARQAS